MNKDIISIFSFHYILLTKSINFRNIDNTYYQYKVHIAYISNIMQFTIKRVL